MIDIGLIEYFSEDILYLYIIKNFSSLVEWLLLYSEIYYVLKKLEIYSKLGIKIIFNQS